MLSVVIGTDHAKALQALAGAAKKHSGSLARITDASPLRDLEAALAGGGMFGGRQTIILDRLSGSPELWSAAAGSLARMAASDDLFLLYEDAVDAATKRLLSKHARTIEAFDLPKTAKERPTVFTLVTHLRAGDRKQMWVAYQRELAAGNAPEAIHGVLFWGAKHMVLAARGGKDAERAKKFLIELTELPHEARRRGEELEYALERFVLTIA